MNPETGKCLFRGPNGLKCALGAIIPDNEYQEIWDKAGYPFSFGGRCGLSALLLACSSLAHLDGVFINELILIHDNRQPEEWREKLADVADANNLSPAILLKLQ